MEVLSTYEIKFQVHSLKEEKKKPESLPAPSFPFFIPDCSGFFAVLIREVSKYLLRIIEVAMECLFPQEKSSLKDRQNKNFAFLFDEFEKQTRELIFKVVSPCLQTVETLEEHICALAYWNQVSQEFTNHLQILEEFQQNIPCGQEEKGQTISEWTRQINEHVSAVNQHFSLIKEILFQSLREEKERLSALSASDQEKRDLWTLLQHAILGWRMVVLPQVEDRAELLLGEVNRFLQVMNRKIAYSLSFVYPPTGLRNLGATCYMNSLLQILYHHVPIREQIEHLAIEGQENPYHPIFTAFSRFCRALTACQNQEMETVSSPTLGRSSSFLRYLFGVETRSRAEKKRELNESLRNFFQMMKESSLFPVLNEGGAGVQHDPDEIVGDLLKAVRCQIEVETSHSLKYKNMMAQGPVAKDQWSVIQLSGSDIAKEEIALAELISAAFSEKGLECKVESCEITGKRQNRRKITFSEEGGKTFKNVEKTVRILGTPPPVLPFLFKRTGYDREKQTMVKIRSSILFDIEKPLDMSPYFAHSPANSKETNYYLTGFYVHLGNAATYGHYCSVVRKTDGFYLLNDEQCHAITPEQAKAYAEKGYGWFFTQEKELISSGCMPLLSAQ